MLMDIAITREAQPERLNCLEVWGGNRDVQKHFETAGLDMWVWNNTVGEADICGGHVHFVSSCASGRITRMLMSEVCGTGPGFRELASELRGLMVQNVNTIGQKRFVSQMYDRFQNFTNVGGLATALIGTYFSSAKSLQLCNAGHPPPFVYRLNEQQWSILMRSEVPQTTQCQETGFDLIDQSEYHHITTTLRPGDMVFAYNNALLEAKDSQGRHISISSLLNYLQDKHWQEPGETIDRMLQELQAFNIDQPIGQDMTLLLYRATNKGVRLKDNLLSPFRLLRRTTDKTDLV